jgi:head-tail adaptor
MAKYKPSGPFVVPFHILSPSKTQVKGVGVKSYVDSGVTFFGAFRTFGGTENVTDGVYVVKNTATLETWYTPELTAAARIVLQDTGEAFEVRGTPEDIERRHQYMIAKLEGVSGDA